MATMEEGLHLEKGLLISTSVISHQKRLLLKNKIYCVFTILTTCENTRLLFSKSSHMNETPFIRDVYTNSIYVPAFIHDSVLIKCKTFILILTISDINRAIDLLDALQKSKLKLLYHTTCMQFFHYSCMAVS